MNETNEVKNIPEVITVHATALITESPDEEISAEYAQSLQKFIFNQEHLKRNIANYDLEHLSSRKMRTSLFTHTAGVKLHVKTSALWENPRSYIWRHFVDNSWTKGNGAGIKQEQEQE